MSSMEELKLDIDELEKLELSATRPKVKDTLQIEIRKLQTKIVQLQENENNKESLTDQPSATACKPATTTTVTTRRTYTVKVTNYGYDQSDKFMKIYVTLNGVNNLDKEKISCNFTASSMDLLVRDLDNKNHNFAIKQLLKPINVEKSYYKVSKDMVVIYLSKFSPENWASVTQIGSKPTETKTPKFDPSDDPSKGIMEMMKQMYQDGDDEMKKTIAKAWTESQNKKTEMDGGFGDL